MVAAATPSPFDRFTPAPEQVLSGRSQLLKFTRRDLPELVRLGFVPEDASTELLNGLIVLTDRSASGEDILRVGRSHRIVVERLSNLRAAINNTIRHVESQQPLACGETHEPQPDFMVVRGPIEQIDEDYPSAADAFCVVEVSDSSYERDTGEKLIGYAKAGIAQYIVINLRNRTAEVYTDPARTGGVYAGVGIVTADKTLSIRVGDSEFFEVPLGDVLP